MINNITKCIIRDPETFGYYVTPGWCEHSFLARAASYVNTTNKLCVPFVTQIVQEMYPFLQQGIKQDIIAKSIVQGNCVHEMITLSVAARNSQKLSLKQSACKNPVHITMAQKAITILNSFIYKYKITNIYSENTFLNLVDTPYVGTPDLVLTNGRDWFIIDIKTSRVNYWEKAVCQLVLYKNMIEKNTDIRIKQNTDIRIKQSFVLNQREERSILEIGTLSKIEKTKLFQILKNIRY